MEAWIVRKGLATAVAALALVGALAGPAAAAAVVDPPQLLGGAPEPVEVRVLAEGAVPTVQVRLEVPPQVTSVWVQPVPGWRAEVERDATGRATAVVWSGGSLRAGEMMVFPLAVQVPGPAPVAWQVQEVLQDGTRLAGPTAGPAGMPGRTLFAARRGWAPSGPGFMTFAAGWAGLVLSVITLIVTLSRRR